MVSGRGKAGIGIVVLAVALCLLTMSKYMNTMDAQMDKLRDVANEMENLKETIESDVSNIETKKTAPLITEPEANKALGPFRKSPANEELERIWNYVYDMQYKCTKSKYLGGKPDMFMDGAYDLCIEPQFWEKANNPDYKCLMYSFGVGWDFSFDDEMAKLGCEVHSFDPAMTYQDGMVRESGVTFHKIGISDKDLEADSNGWKMRTLKTLLKELGHNGRYLDYLKVDTDAPQGGFEDTLMQELLNTGLHQCVRQFAQEIHLMGPLKEDPKLERLRLIYDQLHQLNDQGWRLYNTTDNIRYMLKNNPQASQLYNKGQIMENKIGILWETAFVNFGVIGPCIVV
ncbi:putative methyltransferase-like protein 24 [Ciona intestinalis]